MVLVSLDAFRYDCAERYHAANLLAIAKDGVAPKALIPAFPVRSQNSIALEIQCRKQRSNNVTRARACLIGLISRAERKPAFQFGRSFRYPQR